MLNLDMVGRLDTINPMLKVMRNNKNHHFDSLLNKSALYSFHLNITDDKINLTDAGVFIKNNIPAFSFTTGIHDDYHKVSDIAEKINYKGMNMIVEYLIDFLVKINQE
jgi:Zn-dependent M28 family amino/carboxypeptidase